LVVIHIDIRFGHFGGVYRWGSVLRNPFDTSQGPGPLSSIVPRKICSSFSVEGRPAGHASAYALTWNPPVPKRFFSLDHSEKTRGPIISNRHSGILYYQRVKSRGEYPSVDDPSRPASRTSRFNWNQKGLRSRAVRRLHGSHRRRPDQLLPRSGGVEGRRRNHHGRGARIGRRLASAPGCLRGT
jgi:hypothetical protein